MDIQKKGRRLNIAELTHRLLGNHYPSFIPPTPPKTKPQRKCIVRQNKQNKRKDTTFMCVKCNVGLSPSPCVEVYYTQNKYF